VLIRTTGDIIALSPAADHREGAYRHLGTFGTLKRDMTQERTRAAG
jgi:hypothetical protein